MILRREFALFFLAIVPLFSSSANPNAILTPTPSEVERYMAAVRFAIQQDSPELIQRDRMRVEKQFAKTIFGYPELKSHPYEVRTFGNEVVFYFVSDNDMRDSMQQAMSVLISNLVQDQVRTHGRSVFYKTAITKPLGEYLVVKDKRKPMMIQSLYAKGAPLLDLVQDINKVGPFSYLIPSDCGERAVDWSFGQSYEEESKSVKEVMTELAGALNLALKIEESPRGNYYRFSGDCSGGNRMRGRGNGEFARSNMLPAHAQPPSGFVNAEFLLPVPALRY